MKQIALHVDNGSKKGIMFLIVVDVKDDPLSTAMQHVGWQKHYKILGIYDRHLLEDILR